MQGMGLVEIVGGGSRVLEITAVRGGG